jgi:hypothetical protein
LFADSSPPDKVLTAFILFSSSRFSSKLFLSSGFVNRYAPGVDGDETRSKQINSKSS